MPADSAFGDLLRHHRLAAGLTQEELAEQAGLSVRAISDLERGARRLPHSHTVRQLAQALPLSATDRAALEAVASRRRGPAGADGAPLGRVGSPGNLPPSLTSFVGRATEVADARLLLTSARLVTLTGAGGVGKSRLALEAARAVQADYPDGAWLIELAPLADPALVPQVVARVLGILEQPGRPFVETLVAALRPRQPLLLVLDNCEHLVHACARLAEALLLGCPALRMLATSREPLAIGGELTWRVPSLAVPGRREDRPAALAGCAAVRLFVERAGFARPGFAITDANAPAMAEVCRRLDGIPLALELAAARVAALSVEQIAARLDDRFRLLAGGRRTALPRHQTLEAALDWSHALLTDPERALLRRLAVFAGGWTLEAAEAVGAGGNLNTPDVLDQLLRLVDKSLVQVENQADDARYRLLETVRHYAGEKLRAAGEEATARDRHRDYFLALAEQAAPALRGPDMDRWLARLAAEHDNLRAALDWSLVDADGVEAGLRLAGALGLFWIVRGTLSEGMTWLERALTRGEPAPAAARAVALCEAGHLASLLGNRGLAMAWLEESLALGRALGDGRVIAYALGHLGRVAALQGNMPAAHAYLDEGVAVSRAGGDRLALATVLFCYGSLAQQGNPASARAALEEGLVLLRAIGDRPYTALTLSRLGAVATEQGELAVARAYLEESVALLRTLGMPVGLATALYRLGWLAGLEDDYAAARARYMTSLTIAWGAGGKSLVVPVLEGIAMLLTAEGQAVRAARLFGAAEVVRAASGSTIPWSLRDLYERDVAAARAALGEVAFAAAWAAGQALSLDQAVAEALADNEEDQPDEAGDERGGRSLPSDEVVVRELEDFLRRRRTQDNPPD